MRKLLGCAMALWMVGCGGEHGDSAGGMDVAARAGGNVELTVEGVANGYSARFSFAGTQHISSLPAGDYVVTGTAGGAARSAKVSVVAGQNADVSLLFADAIDAIVAAKSTVAPGETIALDVYAHGDAYRWSTGGIVFADRSSASWTAPTTPGVVSLLVAVSNAGVTSTASLPITVGGTGSAAIDVAFFDAPRVTGMKVDGTPRAGNAVHVTLSMSGGVPAGDGASTPFIHWSGSCLASSFDQDWTPAAASSASEDVVIASNDATCSIEADLYDAAGDTNRGTTVLSIAAPTVTYAR